MCGCWPSLWVCACRMSLLPAARVRARATEVLRLVVLHQGGSCITAHPRLGAQSAFQQTRLDCVCWSARKPAGDRQHVQPRRDHLARFQPRGAAAAVIHALPARGSPDQVRGPSAAGGGHGSGSGQRLPMQPCSTTSTSASTGTHVLTCFVPPRTCHRPALPRIARTAAPQCAHCRAAAPPPSALCNDSTFAFQHGSGAYQRIGEATELALRVFVEKARPRLRQKCTRAFADSGAHACRSVCDEVCVPRCCCAVLSAHRVAHAGRPARRRCCRAVAVGRVRLQRTLAGGVHAGGGAGVLT